MACACPCLSTASTKQPPEETERCVSEALGIGYRLIDTAQVYGNETGVDSAVNKSGIDRSDIFITSKIWVSNMNYERATASIDESLDYIDLMLLHQAMGDYPGAYRAMEDAYKEGKIHAIGVSNFYPERLIDVCALAEVPPAVNQVETHPFHQQHAAHDVMKKLGVAHEAWAPFAEGLNGIFANSILAEIGAKYGKTVGQVILRALLQQDVIVIPKTTHRERMRENIDVFDFTLTDEDMAVFDFTLTDEDMAVFATLDDPVFKPIFDHLDVDTVSGLLNVFVGKQLNGEKFY